MQVTDLYPVAASWGQDEVRETILRRSIRPDLEVIGALLETHRTYTDELSIEIRDWHRNFSSFLTNENFEEVVPRYIALLQELLIDAKSMTPLDKDALLGSDGYTYGLKSLSLYLSSPISTEHRRHSPVNPSDEAVFFTSPHLVARHMVEWLERHRHMPHSAELDNAYQELYDNNLLPIIPTFYTVFIQPVSNRIVQPQPSETSSQNLFSRRIERIRLERREREFAELHRQLNANTEHGLAVHNEIQARLLERRRDLDRAIAVTQAQIQEISDENARLDIRLTELSHKIDDAEKEDIALWKAYIEARERNKKQKKKRLKALGKTIIHIALYAFGTIAINAALESSGIGVGAILTKIPGGGQVILGKVA